MLATLCFQGAIEALTTLSLSEPCLARSPAMGGGVCARMHVCGGVKFLLSSAHMGISKTSHLSHEVWAQSGP